MMRAEIGILAGIYNHDRALFNKGMLKVKKSPMELLEPIVNDEDETKTLTQTIYSGHFNSTMTQSVAKCPVFALGDAIKKKRNEYEGFGDGTDWWKK